MYQLNVQFQKLAKSLDNRSGQTKLQRFRLWFTFYRFFGLSEYWRIFRYCIHPLRPRVELRIIEFFFKSIHDMPSEFNFSRYMRSQYQEYMGELTEVHPYALAVLIVFILLNLLRVTVVPTSPQNSSACYRSASPSTSSTDSFDWGNGLDCNSFGVLSYGIVLGYTFSLCCFVLYICSCRIYKCLLKSAFFQGDITKKENNTRYQRRNRLPEKKAKATAYEDFMEIYTKLPNQSSSSLPSRQPSFKLGNSKESSAKKMFAQVLEFDNRVMEWESGPEFFERYYDIKSELAQNAHYEDLKRYDDTWTRIKGYLRAIADLGVMDRQRYSPLPTVDSSGTVALEPGQVDSCNIIKSVFAPTWRKPYLYFRFLAMCVCGQSVYAVICLTQLLSLTRPRSPSLRTQYQDERIAWIVLLCFPMILNFWFLCACFNYAVLFRAVIRVDINCLVRVFETTVSANATMENMKQIIHKRQQQQQKRLLKHSQQPLERHQVRAQVIQLFAACDANQDHKLSQFEFRQFLASLDRIYLDDAQFYTLWDVVDLDQSGRITWDEMLVCLYPEFRDSTIALLEIVAGFDRYCARTRIPVVKAKATDKNDKKKKSAKKLTKKQQRKLEQEEQRLKALQLSKQDTHYLAICKQLFVSFDWEHHVGDTIRVTRLMDILATIGVMMPGSAIASVLRDVLGIETTAYTPRGGTPAYAGNANSSHKDKDSSEHTDSTEGDNSQHHNEPHLTWDQFLDIVVHPCKRVRVYSSTTYFPPQPPQPQAQPVMVTNTNTNGGINTTNRSDLRALSSDDDDDDPNSGANKKSMKSMRMYLDANVDDNDNEDYGKELFFGDSNNNNYNNLDTAGTEPMLTTLDSIGEYQAVPLQEISYTTTTTTTESLPPASLVRVNSMNSSNHSNPFSIASRVLATTGSIRNLIAHTDAQSQAQSQQVEMTTLTTSIHSPTPHHHQVHVPHLNTSPQESHTQDMDYPIIQSPTPKRLTPPSTSMDDFDMDLDTVYAYEELEQQMQQMQQIQMETQMHMQPQTNTHSFNAVEDQQQHTHTTDVSAYMDAYIAHTNANSSSDNNSNNNNSDNFVRLANVDRPNVAQKNIPILFASDPPQQQNNYSSNSSSYQPPYQQQYQQPHQQQQASHHQQYQHTNPMQQSHRYAPPRPSLTATTTTITATSAADYSWHESHLDMDEGGEDHIPPAVHRTAPTLPLPASTAAAVSHRAAPTPPPSSGDVTGNAAGNNNVFVHINPHPPLHPPAHPAGHPSGHPPVHPPVHPHPASHSHRPAPRTPPVQDHDSNDVIPPAVPQHHRSAPPTPPKYDLSHHIAPRNHPQGHTHEDVIPAATHRAAPTPPNSRPASRAASPQIPHRPAPTPPKQQQQQQQQSQTGSPMYQLQQQVQHLFAQNDDDNINNIKDDAHRRGNGYFSNDDDDDDDDDEDDDFRVDAYLATYETNHSSKGNTPVKSTLQKTGEGGDFDHHHDAEDDDDAGVDAFLSAYASVQDVNNVSSLSLTAIELNRKKKNHNSSSFSSAANSDTNSDVEDMESNANASFFQAFGDDDEEDDEGLNIKLTNSNVKATNSDTNSDVDDLESNANASFFQAFSNDHNEEEEEGDVGLNITLTKSTDEKTTNTKTSPKRWIHDPINC
jgi:hypothetical protein